VGLSFQRILILMSGDIYLQQHVRLENLKEGEARKVVRFLDEVHADLQNKLESAATVWSRERYIAIQKSYEQALDSAFDKGVMPKLKQDGLEFVAKNQAYHYDALVETVTGQTKAKRTAAAASDGFDTDTVFYRGAVTEEKTVGQWFTTDEKTAGFYANSDYVDWDGDGVNLDAKLSPNVKKFYLPKDGVYDFKDKKLRDEFSDWLWEVDYSARMSDPTQEAKLRADLADYVGDIFRKKNGYAPHWEFEGEVIEFLDSKKKGWKVVRFTEFDELGTSNEYIDKNGKKVIVKTTKKNMSSYRTNGSGVAKSTNADFTKTAPAKVKAAASQKLGGAIVTTNLSPAAIYTAATAEPMQGKLMSEWAEGLKRKDKAQISLALRQSWIEGESVSQASKRITPIHAKTKRDLAAITRTYYGHLAAQTRDRVWEENSDIVDGIIWDSILDGRTTIDTCAPRDQLKYTLKGEPIGHNVPYLSGPGQAHWNCRSMGLPFIKGAETSPIKRQAVGAGKNYQRGDNKTRTGRVRTNSAQNRKSGKLKETKVGPKTDYESWLSRQPNAFQDDVLGSAKAKAFRRGEWRLGEKFSPQNPIPLEDF